VGDWSNLLANPAVQSGVAPLAVGFLAALLLYPVRLSGLAAAAGFIATVYLTGNLVFDTSTASRKLVLLAIAAPLLGAVADLAFRPARATGIVLGAIFGLAGVWVYLGVLGANPPQELVLHAVGIFALVFATVAFSVMSHDDPERAGAAGLGLGLGTGISATLLGVALPGVYGLALAAASGGFLLLAMMLGGRMVAGTAFTLSVAVIATLLAVGLPWQVAAPLAAVPLAVRLPIPAEHPWARAALATIYALIAAGGVCALAWMK
jgi:hypothetical protein